MNLEGNEARVRPAKSAAEMSAIARIFTKQTSSKAKFEVMRGQLPSKVQKNLDDGRQQIVDASIYGIKDLNGKQSYKLLEASDDYKINQTNLNRAQLETGKYFLLTAIRLEGGYDYADAGDAVKVLFNNDPAETFDLKESDKSTNAANLVTMADEFANFFNGHFEMKVGTSVVIPEISISEFLHDPDNPNTLVLDNPKMIEPLKEIEPQVMLPAAASKMFVKVTLYGAWTENK